MDGWTWEEERKGVLFNIARCGGYGDIEDLVIGRFMASCEEA